MEPELVYAKTYRGVAATLDEAYAAVQEITDQLSWVIDDSLDIYIGIRDKKLYQYDGMKYHYLVKVII